MILGYDLGARALYIEINDGKIARTREAGDNAQVDLDRDGWVTGIEVISIDHPWPLGAILRDYPVSFAMPVPPAVAG